MSNSILLLFFLSLFFISSTTYSINTTHKCSVQQTQALLHFKQNLSSINDALFEYDSTCKYWLGSGYNPIMMNWNTGIDCCEWSGVTCDPSTGDVIGLDLSCGMVKGTIHPNSTLFHLPRLQRLNLAYNSFTHSQLPPAIDMLSNSLTHLNISSCGFTGQVPTYISHLHKLVSLDLSWNGNGKLNLEPHVFINLLQNLTVMKELSLSEVNISAVLPSNLNISSSSLKLLNLGSTGLQGNLPRNIFTLQTLETLDLSYNRLTGHIPSEVQLLPNLVSLDLSGNGIDFEPHIFRSLLVNSTFLRDLWLREVNIGIVLSTYLNISSSLRILDLSNTSLQGKLPDNILNLKYLEILDLSENNILSGPFPKVNTSTSIPLRMLVLSGCGLNGSLPKSFGNLRYLEFLYLSDNKLSGTLPSSLFTLPSLDSIILDNNMFQGNMPLELFSLQSLKYLYLSNNQLSGQIGVLDNGSDLQTFQRLTNLTHLDLSYNNFRGDWELDALLSSLTNLQVLTLSQSGISVTTSNANHFVNPEFKVISLASCSLKVFPVSIRTMTNLRYLNLANNDIQGHIPDWIGEIGKIQLFVLDLSNNSITGTIPNVYEDWSELEGFVLNGNQLQGKVPTSLYKCQKLKIIDLGNNQLSDTFPDWLGDLPKLQALVLRSNNFHGGIVTSSKVKFPFPSLRVIDLSHNGFVGQLPTEYFQNFNAMKKVVKSNTKPEYLSTGSIYYSITIVMKGVEQHVPRILVKLTIVDLSNNKFKGEIPYILGNLNSLKELNLSHNSLIGQIPHALGNISEIESLDLSWNQLTGEIPQSLADLTFLGSLNLSQNHLEGHIPQRKQFNTFDNYSFGGNPKLCGLPLTKKCSEHPHVLQLEGDRYEEESGFTWKVVVMGYGCGALLGMVLGYIMLSTGRPKWFNAIADVADHMILNRQNKRR
ncbi:putative leucine-rich repeat-containing, plant-type, leucine-rich repeat domain superfamily [Helianthus annuus]|uniref:Leucine-rich repeat-containing, plant-type, leucine-rich repeat domain superfamily n=2 Tax=Helianthus annuus TaxID=4232 RepID=A0A251SMI2_HELAN|nr:putative leucine-rich repeat-containing, plant-type, leucine-rich repeat domain superfamily [Helianthus annuus]KAJ0465968.1 putative leucine-rich repeat-containing, plant-type, leucine-rich repeat domain superfamily [Helianthus annuus]KAJ0470929.1 putative leucine-rich repeat-containing, plant-type, leucine-rich repeat domain superfamily [Helianthus annuus]KAJ0487543.1 putative leucine-rich repeat-containing, plant-type, leucine-rich repeat domain superfamily [Helianthus annuus]KAJ0657987.1 